MIKDEFNQIKYKYIEESSALKKENQLLRNLK